MLSLQSNIRDSRFFNKQGGVFDAKRL